MLQEHRTTWASSATNSCKLATDSACKRVSQKYYHHYYYDDDDYYYDYGRSTRFLPGKPAGGCTEVQKAWQAWTFVDFGQKWKVAEGYKTVVGAYFFAVAELAPNMTLKSYWLQEP